MVRLLSDQDLLRLVALVRDGAISVAELMDYPRYDICSEEEVRTVCGLVLYEIKRLKIEEGQKKAIPLLRSFLTPQQLREMRGSRGSFYMRGSAGGEYRICVHGGFAERVEWHGKRRYTSSRFCYHDPAGELPPADIALAQMFLLAVDEPGFLEAANEQPWPANDGWSPRIQSLRRRRRGLKIRD